MKLLVISHSCVIAANRAAFGDLQNHGLDVELVTPKQLNSADTWIDCEPARADDPLIHAIPLSGRHLRWAYYPDLDEVIEQVQPQAILVESDPASRLVLQLRPHRIKSGIRILCLTNENLSWKLCDSVQRRGCKGLVESIAKKGWHGRAKRVVEHVFTTSKKGKAVFEAAGYRSVSTVPLGLNPAHFRYSSRIRREVRARHEIADEVVLAYYGRMTPEKGVDTLIDALSLVLDCRWRLFLNDFIANSSYARAIQSKIDALGIRDRVTWVRAKHGAISRWMTASDVTILPSRSCPKWVEQFGRVVTEAMACGNVLMVSDSGTPRELVGNCGIVFPEGDSVSLAGRLRQVIENPAGYVPMRAAAIRRARRKYTTQAQARLLAGDIVRVTQARVA